LTTTQERVDFLSAQEWADVGLVLVTGLGGEECEWPGLIRQHTSAPILVYEPREERCFAYVSDVGNCLVSTTIPILRGRMRELAPDITMFPEVQAIFDSEDGLPESKHREVQDLWNDTKTSACLHRKGAAANGPSRVKALLGSLDLLIRCKPINHLWGAFEGVPGVVVGAGPGLDKNLHVLQELQDRCLIVGVNSSLPALNDASIDPHLTVVCEAKPVGPSIAGCQAVCNTIMVPGIHVHRDTFALPWKDIAPAISSEAVFGQWLTRIMGMQSIPIGGSSCCLAAGVLYALGCDPIILIGNDCAASDGQLYHSGAAFAGTTVADDGKCVKSDAKLAAEDVGKKTREVTMPMTETKAWSGEGTVMAPLLYDGLRQWFEEVGEHWKDERRIVNATESGVHILNWEHVSLADALESASVDSDVGDWIVAFLAAAPMPDNGGMISAVKTQIAGAEKVREISREAIDHLKRVKELYAGMDLGERSWLEIEKEKRQEGSQYVFLELADLFRERGQDEAADLLVRCRELQEEVCAQGQSIDLLDAWSWGALETTRRTDTERPAFEILADMFAEIERGTIEVVDKLTLAIEGLSNE
jgi:hypothetical protein